MATAPRRFPGGLFLEPHKIASDAPVQTPALPPRLLVPLLQHVGEPARALVEPGQVVAKGERIGEAHGLLSAHVHAPTSGTVQAIVDHDIGHPSRRLLPCIELEPDGEERWQRLPVWPDWRQRQPAALAARLREAGVVGLGGGVFPTDLKLTASAQPVHTLIINGAECEPYIACDDALLRSRPDEVLAGARVLTHVLSAGRCVLAIEDRMIEALTAVRNANAMAIDEASSDKSDGTDDPGSTAAAIDMVAVPTRYPQGGERQLIATLTGLAIHADELPRQHGVVCVNVATAAAAWRAVVHGEPLLSRIVSVTGSGVLRPGNFEALLGTPAAHLIAAAGGYRADAGRLLLGGPMMGQALAHDQVPIGKSGNCLLVLGTTELQGAGPELPCIRCGECARVCPARLLPQQLLVDVRSGRWPQAHDLHLRDCIECGLCDHVCPSRIALTETFRHGKGELAWQAREQARAELSRQRHEARQERLQRLADARAKRLRAREASLARRAAAAAIEPATDNSVPEQRGPGSSTAAVVAAALARARQQTAGGAANRRSAEPPDDA